MSNVWCADDTFLGDLIYLGNENLIVDSPDTDDTPKIREALLSGQSPASILSSDALNIPLHAVTRIVTDRHDEDIEISYKDGSDEKDKTLRLASPEKRDEVFAALKLVYGDRFEEHEEVLSRPQALVNPVLSLTIFAALTWLFANAARLIRAAEEVEISGSRRGAKAIFAWVLDFLGPIGVSVIGGLICLICVLAIYNAAKQPPVMVTLQAGKYKSRSTVKMLFKYGIVAVVCFFAGKILLV